MDVVVLGWGVLGEVEAQRVVGVGVGFVGVGVGGVVRAGIGDARWWSVVVGG